MFVRPVFGKFVQKITAKIKKIETYPKIKIKYCNLCKIGVC